MKNYIAIIVFLVVGITGMNAQVEDAVDKTKTEYEMSTEAELRASRTVKFIGDVMGDTGDKFELTLGGEKTVTLKFSFGTLLLGISDRTFVPIQDRLDILVYKIDKILPALVDWNEFVIYDLRELTANEKETLLGEPTSKDFIFRLNGGDSDMVLLGDIKYGTYTK